MSDPGRYRSRAEEEPWRRRDSSPRLAKHLREERIADPARLDAIHREVKEEVQAAMRFAEESPEPDAAALYEDLFVENPEELVRDGSESAD
jgi:pyruvate dehydrogenase E1 component alpha subunit